MENLSLGDDEHEDEVIIQISNLNEYKEDARGKLRQVSGQTSCHAYASYGHGHNSSLWEGWRNRMQEEIDRFLAEHEGEEMTNEMILTQMEFPARFEMTKDYQVWIADTGATNHSTPSNRGRTKKRTTDITPRKGRRARGLGQNAKWTSQALCATNMEMKSWIL